jgi:ABC-type transport system substrate-binding protein
MSSPLLLKNRATASLLAGMLLVTGGWTLVAELSAQDPAPQQRKRVEEEEPDSKPAPAKPVREEEEDKAPNAPAPKGKRIEEEEDTPRAPKKVIQVEDDNAPAKPVPGSAGSGSYNLAAEAERTKNRYLKALHKEVAFPHDLVFIRSASSAREEPIVPISIYVGDSPKANWPKGGIKLQYLDGEGKRAHSSTPLEGTVKEVRHYEQIAVRAVDEFLRAQGELGPDNSERLPRQVQLAAAEAVLMSAVRFHDSARSTGQRKGSDWEDAVERPLKSRLLDVRLEQLKALADAGKWETAFNLTVILAREYRAVADQRRIAKPLTDLLESSLQGGVESEEGIRQAVRRLRELEDQFSGNNVLQPITKGLQRHAQTLYAKAKKAAEQDKNIEQALAYISQAVELSPADADLRKYQRDLMTQHRILRVGVRDLPEFLSPAMARTDSELRAVELLFESLVKFGVDANGDARFVPGLAVGRPHMELLGRSFQLPRNAYWSSGEQLTAADIRWSLDWYKEDKGGRLTPTWASLLDDLVVGGDPYRVRLQMQQGVLDPYSLMAFKVLPSGVDPASSDFAHNPVSSGPFTYYPAIKSDRMRPCVSFIFNPLYGARPGKEGLPRIRELRFFTYKPYTDGNNPTEEFDRAAGDAPLDILLDLGTEHAAAIAKKAMASGVRVKLPKKDTTPNRRVYFLAVNNKVQPLDLPNVRRALAHAINREKLLNDFFRPKVDGKTESILGRLHAALNGPFPAGSWACDPKVGLPKTEGSLDLFDEAAARGLFKSDRGVGNNAIRGNAYEVKYPDDDPALKPAMEALCVQLVEVLGFNVKAVGVNRRQLHLDVETGSYELAYYSYDFPDETYSLEPLLARRPGQGGLNIFQSSGGRFESAFQEIRSHRDFARVKQDVWKIHDELYNDMPFIPLWQLDPLAAFHGAVEAPPFDPVLVFNAIERWVAKPRQ